MITPRKVATVALCAAALLAAPSAAHAEAAARGARAQAHVEEGQAAFDAGNYTDAIREFQAAYDLVPEPMISYNLGVYFERLGEREDAIEHFQRLASHLVQQHQE